MLSFKNITTPGDLNPWGFLSPDSKRNKTNPELIRNPGVVIFKAKIKIQKLIIN